MLVKASVGSLTPCCAGESPIHCCMWFSARFLRGVQQMLVFTSHHPPPSTSTIGPRIATVRINDPPARQGLLFKPANTIGNIARFILLFQGDQGIPTAKRPNWSKLYMYIILYISSPSKGHPLYILRPDTATYPKNIAENIAEIPPASI